MPELQIVFMDAGQGDSTLIVYPDNTLTLVDCGSIKNGNTVGSQIAEVINRYAGLNSDTVDNLVLTHPDQDHYNLLQTVFLSQGAPAVGQVYYGGGLSLYSKTVRDWIGTIADRGAPPKTFGGAAPDAKLSRAGVEVYVLAANASGDPDNKTALIKNENSIVLMVLYAGVRIFLMGDADTDTEGFIVASAKQNNLPKLLAKDSFTALKLGHHGSYNSTGDEWLETITPNTLFVSSDTRTFSGTGMPSKLLFTDVLKTAKIDSDLPKNSSYVQFDSDPAVKDFELVEPSKLEVCSTLYELTRPTPLTFITTGGSWYYTVTDDTTITFEFSGW